MLEDIERRIDDVECRLKALEGLHDDFYHAASLLFSQYTGTLQKHKKEIDEIRVIAQNAYEKGYELEKGVIGSLREWRERR